MNPSTERKAIDSLKGIAILGIMLVHSGCSFPGLLRIIANNGSRGVQLMFLINGYLIFKSLDNAQERGQTLKEWYRGKFLRIIPLYWFFTILHLLVFGTGERFYLGPLKQVSWLNILCNLFCLHGFFPYYIGSINLNWFIADLAIWYLIAPVCYKMLNSLEKIISGLLIIIPIDYVLLILAEKYPLISNDVIWSDYISTLCFLAEFPIIMLGGIVYCIVKEGRISGIHKITSYTGCFFAFVGLAVVCIGSDKFIIYSKLFSVGVCFALLLISQLANSNAVLSNSFFAVFGRHSYSIYLCHIFIIHIIDFIPKDLMTGFIGQIGRYVFICAASLMVAVCVERKRR